MELLYLLYLGSVRQSESQRSRLPRVTTLKRFANALVTAVSLSKNTA